MELTTFWFILIAVLWIGYLFLEGFDFGVGMLLVVLGRDDEERTALLRTIGPVWDGNEVWLLVAGGATFAAFPNWYATLFSGFYLPLLLILVALIVRGVGVEYRNKRPDPRWHWRWDVAIAVSSFVPALLWGVAFANIVRGVPINAAGDMTGDLFTLLNPFGLLGGIVTLGLFLLHGSLFVALKTDGDIRIRARGLADRLGPVVLVAGGAFLLWHQLSMGKPWTWLPTALAAVGLAMAITFNRMGDEGWAFAGTGLTVAATVTALFGALYPDVMPSTTSAAFSLTVDNASSTSYTLTVMTWVAVFLTPVVIGYQAWTYHVFHQRITVKRPPDAGEVDAATIEPTPAP